MLVSVNELYREVGWESLDARRRKHKLILFYKMVHGLTPTYLSSLVPDSVGSGSRYNLRNASDLQQIPCRTTSYFNSFLPSVIREWNTLPDTAKHSESILSFKRYLHSNLKPPPKYYYAGNRKAQVLHTRLRTGCSSLNYHLFLKNISNTSLCRCGSVENPEHYFLHCPNYNLIRADLVSSVSRVCNVVTIDILLYGKPSLPYDSNVSVFRSVHDYVEKSKRF